MSIKEMVTTFVVVSSIVAILVILYVLVDWLLEVSLGEKSEHKPHKASKKATSGKGGALLAAVACLSAAAGAVTAAVALKNRGEKKKSGESNAALRLQKSKPIKSRSYHNTGRFKKRY